MSLKDRISMGPLDKYVIYSKIEPFTYRQIPLEASL